jgi:hypothetical protein
MDKDYMILNTNIKLKKQYWKYFSNIIEKQFSHGGKKYALTEDMEATDVVCMMNPGKTGVDWVLQTIAKYAFRFIMFRRERDLIKIATYCYIAWLKCGFHLLDKHDDDTNKTKLDVEEVNC